MKNVMKKIAGLLMVLSVALFAGCSDSSDNSNETTQGTKTYTVSGTVSLGNAVPGSLVNKAITTTNSESRSATSSFDISKLTSEESSFQVIAKQGDETITAPVTLVDGILSYKLVLPVGSEWNLTCQLKVKGVDVLHAKENDMSVSFEEEVTSMEYDFDMEPVYNSNLPGSISLTIHDDSEQIAKVSVQATPLFDLIIDDDPEEMKKLFGEKSFTSGESLIAQSNVPAGSYEVVFSFDDANGNTLYTCREAITVFSGFTTDTWLGTSPYMQDGTFTITDALIEGYGTEVVTTSKNVLYGTYSETTTVDGEDVITTGYKYYLTENAESDISSLPATVTTSYSDKNSFCFDSDGNLYALDYDTQRGSYIISSTKYTDSIAIEGITNLKGITIDQTSNILYAYYGMQGTFELYKFANFISGTDENRKEYTIICDSSSDKSIDFYTAMNEELGHDNAIITIHGGILYGISQSNGGTRIDKMYKVDLSKETLVAEAVDLSKTSLSLSYNATYTDILYQDGAVYILVREVFDTNSRGALLRYDVVFGTVKTLFGPSDNADLSAVKLYTYYDDKQCYSDKELENKFNAPAKISKDGRDFSLLSTLYAPSPLSSTLSKEAFYGPVKFVAIKPRKLVIADDGIAFYTDTDGVLKYKNVNRIVTVDLENFAITESIETKVKFEKDTSDMKEIGNAGTVFNNSTGFQDVFESLLGTVFYTEDKTSTGIGSGDLNFAIPCGDTN